MAVSLVSTGVQFPDSTIQTTAATASSPPLTTNVRQAVTSSATTAINFSSGNTVDLTMAANITTMTFSGVAASGTAMLVQIVVINASSGTAYTIVWPTSVYWNATTSMTVQTAPTLATGANGVTVISLLTTDGGTKWRGWVESSLPGGTLGSLYAWGQNSSGRLGLGNTTAYSSPKQVGSLTNWFFVTSCGFGNAAAIKTDGTLWTWGSNNYGQLGLGNVTSYSSPKQVGGLTTWSKITNVGSRACVATQTNGTIWSWGQNNIGTLGLNGTANQNSPTQIGSLTNWSAVASGQYHVLATKTDGTLWVWGNNNYGQLGLGNLTAYSSPKQLGALTTWSILPEGVYNSSAAIKTDGTLWTWGQGASGVLGLGTTYNVSTPVQVGALTNWSKIGAGFAAAAIKTDGTLWTWGKALYGSLGLGNTTNTSSPKQVGANTDWTGISVINYGFMATRGSGTTGALWVWGRNNTGVLGLGNLTNYSSPKQVGALTNWKVGGGGFVCNNAFGIIVNSISPA